MNRFRKCSVWPLVLVIVLLTSTSASASSNAQQAEYSKLYTAALLQGSADAVEHLFSDKVKIMPEYDKSYLGKASARQYYASIFQRYEVVHYVREELETTDIGERRLEIGSFELRIRTKENDQTTAVSGTYFDIWDTSSSQHQLLTLAWNFSEKVEGIEQVFRADSTAGVHYAFEPTVPTTDTVTAEVVAGRTYGSKLMLRRQPSLLSNQYHPDAWYSPHDRPIVKGRAAIKEFNLDYAKNWPAFDYVDVNAHELYVHGDYVIEHMSYNLRWRTHDDYSGISIGKGVRLAKRDDKGLLKAYRSISMHD